MRMKVLVLGMTDGASPDDSSPVGADSELSQI